MNVLSLFDGMSCGQLALQRSGIQVNKYYASEIDKYAIKIAQKNFPNTVQLGDVVNVKSHHVDKIVLGCTHYPFLRPVFDKLLPQNVDLVNPAPAVARQTLRQLERFELQTKNIIEPKYEFYTSGNEEILESFLKYIQAK